MTRLQMEVIEHQLKLAAQQADSAGQTLSATIKDAGNASKYFVRSRAKDLAYDLQRVAHDLRQLADYVKTL